MSKNRLSLVKSTEDSIRELTQVEYQHLFPDIHRNPVKFARFLKLYNDANPGNEIKFFDGTRTPQIRRPYVVVYRETLPDNFQLRLDKYEATLDAPFIGGYFHKRKSSQFKPTLELVKLSSQKYKD